MKLYMVTDGHYSDYSVRGIYSTQEKAEWAKKVYKADNEIDEIELDALPESPPGMLWYSVDMDAQGNGMSVEVENAEYAHKDEWRPYGDGVRVAFYMWAKDEAHAVKIANERRGILIATGQWTTDLKAWRDALA